MKYSFENSKLPNRFSVSSIFLFAVASIFGCGFLYVYYWGYGVKLEVANHSDKDFCFSITDYELAEWDQYSSHQAELTSEAKSSGNKKLLWGESFTGLVFWPCDDKDEKGYFFVDNPGVPKFDILIREDYKVLVYRNGNKIDLD